MAWGLFLQCNPHWSYGKLQIALPSLRTLHSPYLPGQLTEAANRHCTLSTSSCRKVQETGPEMMPDSSGTPGPGPQHHLDLSGTLTQTEALSCLGLGLTGCLGLLTESWWSLRGLSATNVPLRQRRPPASKALSQQECITSRLKEVVLPVLSTGETHLQPCVQLWAPQCKRNTDTQDGVQWKATKMEHLSYEERLRQITTTFFIQRGGSDWILSMWVLLEGSKKMESGFFFMTSPSLVWGPSPGLSIITASLEKKLLIFKNTYLEKRKKTYLFKRDEKIMA